MNMEDKSHQIREESPQIKEKFISTLLMDESQPGTSMCTDNKLNCINENTDHRYKPYSVGTHKYDHTKIKNNICKAITNNYQENGIINIEQINRNKDVLKENIN